MCFTYYFCSLVCVRLVIYSFVSLLFCKNLNALSFVVVCFCPVCGVYYLSLEISYRYAVPLVCDAAANRPCWMYSYLTFDFCLTDVHCQGVNLHLPCDVVQGTLSSLPKGLSFIFCSCIDDSPSLFFVQFIWFLSLYDILYVQHFCLVPSPFVSYCCFFLRLFTCSHGTTCDLNFLIPDHIVIYFIFLLSQ